MSVILSWQNCGGDGGGGLRKAQEVIRVLKDLEEGVTKKDGKKKLGSENNLWLPFI
jgi:hypothetical protein